jgi:hypothetical protein
MIKMSDDKAEFLAELRGSRVTLCKRAATSLSCAWSEVAEQQQEIAELKAMVGALKCKALEVITSNSSNTGYEPSISVFQRDITELYNLHQAIPAQCLASVKADAIDEAVKSCSPSSGFPPDDPPQGLQEYCEALYSVSQYAQQLREQK